MRRRVFLGLAAAAIAVASAAPLAIGRRPTPTPPSEILLAVPAGLDTYVPGAPGIGSTRTIRLGEALFFETGLSEDGTRSCASCHRPEYAFADTNSVSPGVHGRLGNRNAPSIVNAAYGASFGWDGAASTLEEQVLRPFGDPVEFGASLGGAIERLRQKPEYRAAFRRAYGGGIDPEKVAQALADYVRTLLSGNSHLDRFRAGDTLALSAEARAGFLLFNGRARCSLCHTGPLFSDGEFHNTGVSPGADPGRMSVTGRPGDRGAFRTPSLRNVARTAPYMHDGSMRSLEEVVDFYDRGGGPNAFLDAQLRPLDLTPAEKAQLIVFLRALTSGEHALAARE
ncbi:MAG TPA: cytochrome c peroxidase [Longimicrobiales bacterium]|nr:cytochrome c peroxidase [Longimicrobiales bacterium]